MLKFSSWLFGFLCLKHDLEDDCIMFWVVVFCGVLSSLACWWPLTAQHIVGRGLREGGELQLKVKKYIVTIYVLQHWDFYNFT